ncbi:unnamed protein product [Cyclocybe aegerita]|uniref:G domain-containing protein n=1 Tax=Cyclocybe aegerita TaxID=1973307 RepID=A0A8S0WNN3_CYCAE|nr:unnamed protein product [Cyclocybe aegerita]
MPRQPRDPLRQGSLQSIASDEAPISVSDASSPSPVSESSRERNTLSPTSRRSPAIIMLMGLSGTGKSNFINKAISATSGFNEDRVGHGLTSHTQSTEVVRL